MHCRPNHYEHLLVACVFWEVTVGVFFHTTHNFNGSICCYCGSNEVNFALLLLKPELLHEAANVIDIREQAKYSKEDGFVARWLRLIFIAGLACRCSHVWRTQELFGWFFDRQLCKAFSTKLVEPLAAVSKRDMPACVFGRHSDFRILNNLSRTPIKYAWPPRPSWPRKW